MDGEGVLPHSSTELQQVVEMKAFERWVRWYCDVSIRQPWWPLLVLILATGISLVLARGLDLETDLKHLLPDDAPSVLALEEAGQRTRGTDQFVIAVTSTDALANVRFVDALAARMGDWEEVDAFENVQDQSFYREHALLLLPVEDLQDIKRKLQRLIRRRLGQSNPLYIDLEREDDAAEASAEGLDPEDEENERRWRDISYWIPERTLAGLGQSKEEAQRMFSFTPEVAPAEGSAITDGPPPMVVHRNALPDEYADYRLSPDGRVALMVARLKGRATDVSYAQEAFERGVAAIEALDPASFAPDMRAEVVGSYRGFLEVRSVTRDMSLATQISLGLVFLILVGFFRSLRSVLIVMSPLLMGIVWTGGLMEVLFGRLSTLTAFVFAMLIGMGIDFAIHLYSRTTEEWKSGLPWTESLFLAITRTGRALLTATVTTVASLLMLCFASFDGFVEFGIACAAGVGICLLSTTLLMPPMVGITEKLWPLRRPVVSVKGAGGPAVVVGAGYGWLRGAAVLVLVLTAVAAWLAPGAEFEYDFAELRGPGSGQSIGYGSAIGSRRGSTPVVILGSGEEQMREVHELLTARLGEDAMLKSFVTIETLVPADQPARMEVINEIYEVLDRRAVQNIDGDEGELIATLTEMTDTEVFTSDQLPEWVRRDITERDGTFGSIGQLYGNYNRWHALEVAEFQQQYQTLETSTGPVLLASNSFVIADVMRYVQADGLKLAWLVMLGLVVVIALDFRTLRGTFYCMFTISVAIVLTVGMMVVFGIKLGLYNMVVLPTVLGTGIDGAIHMYHRYLEEPDRDLWVVLRTTGLSVVASSVTTLAGFIGLVFVSHKGVNTIGGMACLGIAASLVTAVFLLPGLIALLEPPTKKQEPVP